MVKYLALFVLLFLSACVSIQVPTDSDDLEGLGDDNVFAPAPRQPVDPVPSLEPAALRVVPGRDWPEILRQNITGDGYLRLLSQNPITGVEGWVTEVSLLEYFKDSIPTDSLAQAHIDVDGDLDSLNELQSLSVVGANLILSNGDTVAIDSLNYWKLIDSTLTYVGDVEVVGSSKVSFSATENGEQANEMIVDAAGFSDIEALDIIYHSGAISPGEEEAAVLVNIDQVGSTGGKLSAVEVVTTVVGSAEVTALRTGVGIDPISQSSGLFGDASIILVNAVNETIALSSGGAGNVSAFQLLGDDLTVGSPVMFQEIEFILSLPASQGGISPLWEYSTGVGTWAPFGPIDGTNGMRTSGSVLFSSDLVSGWAPGVGGDYLVRITRTRSNLNITPVVDMVQVAAVVEYGWNTDGDVSINELNLNATIDNNLDSALVRDASGVVRLRSLSTVGSSQDSIAALRVDINQNTTDINQNSLDISDNQDSITALRNDISASGHDPVTMVGTPDYITLSGQEITRNQIDLTTDVTGVLPPGNGGGTLINLNDSSVTALSDVTDAGSGEIITTVERNQIASNTSSISSNVTAISTNAGNITGNTTAINNHVSSDNDLSSTNELQTLSVVDDSLGISGGNTVALPAGSVVVESYSELKSYSGSSDNVLVNHPQYGGLFVRVNPDTVTAYPTAYNGNGVLVFEGQNSSVWIRKRDDYGRFLIRWVEVNPGLNATYPDEFAANDQDAIAMTISAAGKQYSGYEDIPYSLAVHNKVVVFESKTYEVDERTYTNTDIRFEGNDCTIKIKEPFCTTLTASYTGGTTVNVSDASGFKVGHKLLIADGMGFDSCCVPPEIVSISGNVLTVGATTCPITMPIGARVCTDHDVFTVQNEGGLPQAIALRKTEFTDMHFVGNYDDDANECYSWRLGSFVNAQSGGASFRECSFRGHTAPQVFVAYDCDFDNCRWENNALSPFHITQSASYAKKDTIGQVVVNNCVFINNNNKQHLDVHSESIFTFSANVRNVRVNKCYGYSNGGAIFGPVTADDIGFSMSDCDFYDSDNISSFALGTADNIDLDQIQIHNNNFYDCGDLLIQGVSAINESFDNLVITDNVFWNSRVAIKGTENLLFSGNTVMADTNFIANDLPNTFVNKMLKAQFVIYNSDDGRINNNTFMQMRPNDDMFIGISAVRYNGLIENNYLHGHHHGISTYDNATRGIEYDTKIIGNRIEFEGSTITTGAHTEADAFAIAFCWGNDVIDNIITSDYGTATVLYNLGWIGTSPTGNPLQVVKGNVITTKSNRAVNNYTATTYSGFVFKDNICIGTSGIPASPIHPDLTGSARTISANNTGGDEVNYTISIRDIEYMSR